MMVARCGSVAARETGWLLAQCRNQPSESQESHTVEEGSTKACHEGEGTNGAGVPVLCVSLGLFHTPLHGTRVSTRVEALVGSAVLLTSVYCSKSV